MNKRRSIYAGWTLLVVVSLVVGSAIAQSKSSSRGSGSICIAPTDRPTKGEKSLSNPAGGNRVSQYSIQVDNMTPVVASNEKPIRIASISKSRKHVVKIFGDGELKESFAWTSTSIRPVTFVYSSSHSMRPGRFGMVEKAEQSASANKLAHRI